VKKSIDNLNMDEKLIINSTINWYNENAKGFIEKTINLDIQKSLYSHFLPRVVTGGHILDAGCGAGRDIKMFHNLGFQVTAFDASSELVEFATKYSGVDVLNMYFSDVNWENTFDGIWACASLLHIPKSQMIDAIRRLILSLKVGGVFFLGYKIGENDGFVDGRFFSNYTIPLLLELMSKFPDILVVDSWTDNQFCNVICKKLK
jgi:2-polyprenyl-3-methyl-5-hydroxy-6-metoxy-1,4-benzoquinol methylase